MPKIGVVESFSNSGSDIEQLHSPLKGNENSPPKQSATSSSDTDKENISRRERLGSKTSQKRSPSKRSRGRQRPLDKLREVTYPVFHCKDFNERDLGDNESPLRRKFNEIIKDLEENKYTSLGDIKLIYGNGGIKYFRAKLSDSDRLLFTNIEHNGKNVFVMLEVILNHKYDKSRFLEGVLKRKKGYDEVS